jgi:hypothetical protein
MEEKSAEILVSLSRVVVLVKYYTYGAATQLYTYAVFITEQFEYFTRRIHTVLHDLFF